MIGQVFVRIQLGEIPARRIGMQPVHEGGVVAHLFGQGRQQVADALLLLDIDVKIADHDHAAGGADALLAAGKFARGHVALHDIYALLGIEGDARDFVETDYIVETNQSALAAGIVDEHLGHRGFAAGDEMGVG